MESTKLASVEEIEKLWGSITSQLATALHLLHRDPAAALLAHETQEHLASAERSMTEFRVRMVLDAAYANTDDSAAMHYLMAWCMNGQRSGDLSGLQTLCRLAEPDKLHIVTAAGLVRCLVARRDFLGADYQHLRQRTFLAFRNHPDYTNAFCGMLHGELLPDPTLGGAGLALDQVLGIHPDLQRRIPPESV